MQFAYRIRMARVAAGYSQEEIAALLGIKPNTYNRYEGGRGDKLPSIMPPWLIPTFCTACHITEEWLFRGKGRGPSVGRPMRRIGAA